MLHNNMDYMFSYSYYEHPINMNLIQYAGRCNVCHNKKFIQSRENQEKYHFAGNTDAYLNLHEIIKPKQPSHKMGKYEKIYFMCQCYQYDVY